MSVLIKNGRIITAVDDYMGDVFIENETVTHIGKSLDMEADEILDASGKYLFPGGLDPHTHLDMPFGGTVSADDFETGTRAAAHGGTTTLIDFAIQPKGQSTLEALDTWHAKAEGKTAIDYGFHMIITDLEDDRVHERLMKVLHPTNYSWPIRVSCMWMMERFTVPCARPAKTERLCVCMLKMVSLLMKL